MNVIFALLSVLLLTQAHADPKVGKLDQREVDYYNSLQAKCGTNLLCYYSAAEIQDALGVSPAQALAKGLLDEAASDRFAAEDFQAAGNGLFSPIEEQQLGDSVSRRRSSPAPKSSRGGGAISGANIIHALVGFHQSSGPIWGRFIATLKSCSPGCVPKDYNCHRDGAFSCHNIDHAVDVGAIVCKGKTDYAIDRGVYADLVTCARKKGLKVLYMQAGSDLTEAHHNHGHFSMGCTRADGMGWW